MKYIALTILTSIFFIGCGNSSSTTPVKNEHKKTLAEKRAHMLSKEHLKNLTIDFGVIECWERGTSKYIVIDYAGTIYAVNGKARSHAKKTGWKEAKSILKKDGEFTVFSDIIQVALKNGCTPYYGL